MCVVSHNLTHLVQVFMFFILLINFLIVILCMIG